jgi:hypothetical protein
MRAKVLQVVLFLVGWAAADAKDTVSRVSFNEEGMAIVEGKPFFPIGMFIYELNAEVLAELHELQCNTVLHGFEPQQLDLIERHGLKAICATEPPWVDMARGHPATLAWYLRDEPENRGVTPQTERERYLELKKKDPNHPIGLCHTAFEALAKFKDACDFTMTDIYPITPRRDQNIMGVSIMMDEARRIHGSNWPQWTYIQTFGGPETDNGVWAVPLPHEIRFMTYQALVHRATGILYFSYWPRQPRTWQSVAEVNREVQRLVPRLVAPGKEGVVKCSVPEVQARVRLSGKGNDRAASGLIIAINTSPKFVECEIECREAPAGTKLPFENSVVEQQGAGKWSERFSPYGVHVYEWGE